MDELDTLVENNFSFIMIVHLYIVQQALCLQTEVKKRIMSLSLILFYFFFIFYISSTYLCIWY